MGDMINFETNPSQYRHWHVEYDGDVARLIMDVDEAGGLFEGYELKLNSYDSALISNLLILFSGCDEHPEVKVVVLQSGKDKVFAPARISHAGGRGPCPQGELLQIH